MAIFEGSLESMRVKYQFDIYGYMIMPEHVHLLVTEPSTHPLSTVIGALKRSVSKQLPQSPFWLPRYYDRNIWSADERVEKLRYMHRNPVTRGLVERPEEYRWSSFLAHLRGAQGEVTVTTRFPGWAMPNPTITSTPSR